MQQRAGAPGFEPAGHLQRDSFFMCSSRDTVRREGEYTSSFSAPHGSNSTGPSLTESGSSTREPGKASSASSSSPLVPPLPAAPAHERHHRYPVYLIADKNAWEALLDPAAYRPLVDIRLMSEFSNGQKSLVRELPAALYPYLRRHTILVLVDPVLPAATAAQIDVPGQPPTTPAAEAAADATAPRIWAHVPQGLLDRPDRHGVTRTLLKQLQPFVEQRRSIHQPGTPSDL